MADRNVARRVDAAVWQALCQRMSAGFAGGANHDGTLAALAELNDLLCLHFPADGARQNQLPNQAIIV